MKVRSSIALPKVRREQVDEHTEHKTDGKRGERLKDARQHQVLCGVLHEVQTEGHQRCHAQTENCKSIWLLA